MPRQMEPRRIEDYDPIDTKKFHMPRGETQGGGEANRRGAAAAQHLSQLRNNETVPLRFINKTRMVHEGRGSGFT